MSLTFIHVAGLPLSTIGSGSVSLTVSDKLQFVAAQRQAKEPLAKCKVNGDCLGSIQTAKRERQSFSIASTRTRTADKDGGFLSVFRLASCDAGARVSH